MNKRNKICIGILLLLIVIVNIHYLNLKSGYYVDEGMTLFLANGHYNGTVTSKSEYDIGDFIRMYVIKEGDGPAQVIGNIRDMLAELTGAGNYSSEGTVGWYDAARSMLQGTPTWVSGDELFRELTAGRGERFQYGQVYINQALDVHPILYYVVVHTVFSIFAGRYSDAFLFGINIVFLILTCILIYRIVKRYWNDAAIAMLAVAIFGLSQGFVSCAVYFRMYAMLTFFVMLVLDQHIRLCNHAEDALSGRKKRFLMGLAVWAGFNTHYYFILFMLPLFVMTCFQIGKNKKILWQYIKIMIIAGVVSVIFWPFSIYHILFGYRGTEALANVASAGILGKLYGCFKEFANALTLGNTIVLAAVFVLIAVVIIINTRKKKQELRMLAEMIVPGVVYLIAVAQIAPSISDRYVMCLFPIIAVIMAYGIMQGIALFIKSDRVRTVFSGVLVTALLMISITAVTPNYLYREQCDWQLGIQGEKADHDCLMIGYDHGQGFSEAVKLSEFANVLVAGKTELDAVEIEQERLDRLVVYVFAGMNVDETLAELSQKAGVKGAWTQIDSDVESFQAYIYDLYKTTE